MSFETPTTRDDNPLNISQAMGVTKFEKSLLCEKEDDITDFWLTKILKHEALASVALRVLATRATSCSSEWGFSQVKKYIFHGSDRLGDVILNSVSVLISASKATGNVSY